MFWLYECRECVYYDIVGHNSPVFSRGWSKPWRRKFSEIFNGPMCEGCKRVYYQIAEMENGLQNYVLIGA